MIEPEVGSTWIWEGVASSVADADYGQVFKILSMWSNINTREVHIHSGTPIVEENLATCSLEHWLKYAVPDESEIPL